MSSQPFQQLQAHKDSVKDKLQGVLATVAKVPALVHADTSKEVSPWPCDSGERMHELHVLLYSIAYAAA
jgi:hypothetical protein